MLHTIQIAARLTVARKAAGYKSARDFFAAHNIPGTTYIQHEAGKRGLDSPTTKEYCDLLNINEEWLLTGNGHVFKDHLDPCQKVPAKELAYAEALSKLSANSSLIQPVNIDLLTLILTELLQIHQSQNANAPIKQIVSDALTLYFDISSSTDDPAVREKLLKSTLLAYKLMAKK